MKILSKVFLYILQHNYNYLQFTWKDCAKNCFNKLNSSSTIEMAEWLSDSVWIQISLSQVQFLLKSFIIIIKLKIILFYFLTCKNNVLNITDAHIVVIIIKTIIFKLNKLFF